MSVRERTVGDPWLSVILPTFNGSAYLAEALDSILIQGDDDIEVLALDDGSTDDTLPILGSYAGRLPLRIVQLPAVGSLVKKVNLGLPMARGTHVCVLPQDDFWLKGRLAAVRQALDRCPEATLVVHPVQYVDAQGRSVGVLRCPLPSDRWDLSPEFVITRLLVQNFICLPAVLFERKTGLAVGGMDERLWYTGDWDFYLKLVAAGKLLYLKDALAAYRLHPESATMRLGREPEEFRWQMESVLDRHLTLGYVRPADLATVTAVARLVIDMNVALAARAHGQQADVAGLARRLLSLGPPGWRRFLRDSRMIERVSARLRSGLARRRHALRQTARRTSE